MPKKGTCTSTWLEEQGVPYSRWIESCLRKDILLQEINAENENPVDRIQARPTFAIGAT